MAPRRHTPDDLGDPDPRRLVTPGDMWPLERLRAPVWVYDFERALISWMNEAGLSLFNATDLAGLQDRHRNQPMSHGMVRRLATVRARLRDGDPLDEDWTYYPEGRLPVHAACRFQGIRFHEKETTHDAMLVEVAYVHEHEDLAGRRFAEAMRHANERVTLFSLDGQTLERNPAAEAIFLPAANDVSDFAALFADPEVADHIRKMVMAGDVFLQDLPVHTAHGPCWHQTEVRRILDPVTGEPVLLCLQHDITALRSSEKRLENARLEAVALRQKAETANEAKSAFLTMMSHELRTPMTGALAAAEALRVSGLSEEQQETLQMVFDGSEQMLSLIDEILDFTQTDGDARGIEHNTVMVREWLEEATLPLRVAAAAKGISVVLQSEETPTAIAIQSRRLRRLLHRLLDDAVQATEEGTVEIQGALLEVDGDHRLRVEIRDPRPGPQDHASLPHHLAAPLAGAMSVEVESRWRDDGVTSWFSVPVQTVDAGAHVAEEQLGLRLLIVDDNALNRRSLARLLRHWRCDTHVAADGAEALRAIRLTQFDGILMDINMPRLSGPETTRAIRSAGFRGPIVAITADAFFADEQPPLFDRTLYKPLGARELHQTLWELMHASDEDEETEEESGDA